VPPVLLQTRHALAQETGRKAAREQCNFENPTDIPHYWEPECAANTVSLGCNADGTHNECRFCGGGEFSSVVCPHTWCNFANPPLLPYYWDPSCTDGDLGCLADGEHLQCRFCGEYPYNGTVPCPDSHNVFMPPNMCDFDNTPVTPYFWDATCIEGMLGCNADNKHVGCRFCGRGDYADIACPPWLCTFEPRLDIPSAPYWHYWEPSCWQTSEHVLGCLADGIHPECRYCGGGEYESLTCPQGAAPR